MLKKNSKVFISDKNNEIVIMNMEKGQFWGLQDVSYDIWKSLDECKNIEEIADKIVDKYEVEKDEAIRDINNIIEEMKINGLVIDDEDVWEY